ncbi:MAG: hypothetical protein JF607_25250 [Burkholderiales bacterium]|nr:hypothetical protein [Burkholderiales bacterium]
MQRIKHHYCWVKAVAVPGDDEHFVEAPPSEAAAAFPAGSVHIDWQNDPGAISSRLSITQTARPLARVTWLPWQPNRPARPGPSMRLSAHPSRPFRRTF